MCARFAHFSQAPLPPGAARGVHKPCVSPPPPPFCPFLTSSSLLAFLTRRAHSPVLTGGWEQRRIRGAAQGALAPRGGARERGGELRPLLRVLQSRRGVLARAVATAGDATRFLGGVRFVQGGLVASQVASRGGAPTAQLRDAHRVVRCQAATALFFFSTATASSGGVSAEGSLPR